MLQAVSQPTQIPPATVLANDKEANTLTLETRFGEVTVSTDNPIIFPQGLLGIAGNFQYAMTDFPSEKLGEFKLLQSLDDHSVSFITLPLPLENAMIDYEDIVKAAGDVGVSDMENLVVMLIVSVHRSPLEVKLSANTRAPLLVYLPTRAAVQYVFQSSKYQVQHMLGESN
jgi:flagellar assembly factor FliW